MGSIWAQLTAMKYQLNRDGLNLGEFTLDEIRRGRLAGRFDGRELIWGEGMPQWQPLEDFLRERFPPASTPPPIPLPPEQRRNRLIAWVVAIIGLLFLSGLVLIGFGIAKFVQRARQYSTAAAVRPEALAAASKPVVIHTNTLTEADQRVRRRAFRMRQWVEGYRQNADHRIACDAGVTQLMERWVEENYGVGRTTNGPTAQELADRLVATAGCEEPMMLTVAGVEAAELQEATLRLDRAVKHFEASPQKAYPKLYATAMLVSKLGSRSERVAMLDEAAMRHLRDCFTDGSLRPDDAPEIAEILIFGWGREFFERNAATICGLLPDGNKHPQWHWLSLVLTGEHHIMAAWRARGGGYAESVTAQGWSGFQSHLAAARTAFTTAWQLRPDLPLAPSRMIYVSLGDSGITEMREWFDRTVVAQLDYAKAWSDLRWGLRPRWHGDEAAMLALGITALNTGRFDTDVPRMLFDSISDMEAEEGLSPREHIYWRDDIWPHLQRMYEGYIAEPKQGAYRDGWRSTYAVVAYLAGHYDVARQQFEALEWNPWTHSLENWRTDLSLLPLEVAALTGSLSNEVSAAEMQREESEFAAALAAYKKLPGDPRADERTRRFVRHRIATLEVEERLHRGEWVGFLPTQDDDPAWNVRNGTYRVLGDGAVEVASGKLGHMIVCRARAGAEFEVKGEFEVLQTSTGDFQAGLVLGMPDWSNSDWFAFRLKRNRAEGPLASYSRGWSRQQDTEETDLVTGVNSFELHFIAGLLDATVNGKRAHSGAQSPGRVRYDQDEFLIGLGAFNDMNDTVIRYRNVQLRLMRTSNASGQN